ncbi:MAG TPA: FG-GAP-like repeat-containing protein, partial [Flavobacterium sp.]|nr:FG-GAP-like repeat-containing protein [Flavobacterium sp.]
GDFLDDIVTVNAPNVTVYLQKTAGGFEAHTYNVPGLTNNPGWSIAAGDYDRNGFNDLILGGSDRTSVLKANDTGTGFTQLVHTTESNPNVNNFNRYIFSQRNNFIDIDNDGNLDVFACHDVDQNHIYRNDGAGNLVFDISLFVTPALAGNYATVWTDFDNDGDMDMFEAKCRGGSNDYTDPQRINVLYRNNGDGTFTNVAPAAGVADGAQSWSTAFADYDNDGDMDYVLSNVYEDQNKFYRNNGDGTFTDIIATSGINLIRTGDGHVDNGSWEIQQADFNNDGFVDFLWQNSKQLYINNGDMTFTGYNLAFSEGAIGDFNNDGFLDVQTGNKVYYNSGNPNKWLGVKLQGVTSNRSGIGARIEIYGAWGKQIREIRSGEGFSHMSSLNAHFGIGTASAIEKVVVRWPSGTVDTILNPSSNQNLFVLEGSSVLGVDQMTNSDFSVFPNPTSDVLNIKSSNNAANITNAQVFDLSGRVVLSSDASNNTVDVKSLSTGSYIISLKDAEGRQFTKKFIKK